MWVFAILILCLVLSRRANRCRVASCKCFPEEYKKSLHRCAAGSGTSGTQAVPTSAKPGAAAAAKVPGGCGRLSNGFSAGQERRLMRTSLGRYKFDDGVQAAHMLHCTITSMVTTEDELTLGVLHASQIPASGSV